MTIALPEGTNESVTTQLSDVVSANLGLHYPPDRWPDLLRGVQAMLADAGTKPGPETDEAIRRLASGAWRPEDSDNLAHHLTVGETYFWREHQALEALRDKVLPPLIAQRRHQGRLRLRLWSAGCCTGEEPYSLGILLHRLLPDIEKWDVRVLATDLNPTFLKKARTGKYRKWSFRGTPPWIRDRYFTPSPDESWSILPEISKLVDFATLNLASDSYPAAANHTEEQDILLCRNVLIYMEPVQAQNILTKFQESLVEGGWLVLSATETWLMQSSRLSTVTAEGAILFHKGQHAATPPAAAAQTGSLLSKRLKGSSLPPNSAKKPVSAAPRAQSLAQQPQPPATSGLKTTTSRLNREQSGSAAREDAVSPNARGDSTSIYQEAFALYESGLYLQVVEYLTQSTAASQKDPLQHLEPDTLVLLAKAHANSAQADLALAACDRALTSDRLYTAAYYLKATILQDQNKVDEAMQSLTRALFLEPNFIMAHFSMGNLASRLGKTQEACRHWNNALQQLTKCPPEETLAESEDMTVQHLTGMITVLLRSCE